LRREFFQLQGLVASFLDAAAHFPNSLYGRVRSGGGQRATSQARAEPVSFRVRRRLIEAHVLAEGLARRARRLAIDAGGENAIEETTVPTGISVLNRFPAPSLVQHQYLPNFFVVTPSI